MMCEMKIAVVIPMYNSENTIKPVLEAIEHQTFAAMIDQVIVVDDGSTDTSQYVVTDYIKNSQLNIRLVSKANGGVSSARNEGVRNVERADWVAFCDSDDVWHSNKIERQVEVLISNDQIDCLGTQCSDDILKIGFKTIKNLHRATVKEICIKNFPQPSTVLIRKEVFDRTGGFDISQRYAEDGNFFLRVAAKNNLYYLPEKLIDYGFNKRGFGISGLSANLKGMYEGNIKNLKEIFNEGYISRCFYIIMRAFYYLKYIRRKVIVKFD